MLPQELVPLFPVALFHVVVTVEAVERGLGDVNPPVYTKRRSLYIPDEAGKGHAEFCPKQS